jgi:hypothetical protein
MSEAILLNLLTAASAEFTKINADLAATGRNLKISGTMADSITGQVRARKQSHIEFSAFTGDEGRAW